MKKLNLLTFAAAALLLAACDQTTSSATAADAQAVAAAAPAPQPARPRPVVRKICADCGVISSIQQVKIEGEGTGMGAVAGAAAGGYAGNQFGGGNGKIATTAVGVLAGAAAGHYAEKQIRSKQVQRLTIRMDGGNARTVDVAELNGMTIGTKVKVSGNTVYPYTN